MTVTRRLLLALVVALSVWAFFAWPVPRYMTRGIICASLNVEKGGVRAMIPGDHLQFLYQFWLTSQALRGKAPPFVNPYEFNIGRDGDGAFRGTYYIPFALFHMAGAAVGGPAFGYNVDHVVTMSLTLLFLWLLARRYVRDEGLAFLAALAAFGIPYAWITMFDGSPTGLSMMWIPFIYWALDIMVVERKPWAGALAGVGICLAESDSHVFFFALLSAPVWCLLSYALHPGGRRSLRDDIVPLFKAASLLLLFLGVAAWEAWMIRHSIQGTTLVATSRSFEEIRAGSSPLSGLVKFINPGDSRKIYLGWYLLALLMAGALLTVRGYRRSGEAGHRFPLPAVVACGVVLAGICLLATGVMNPLGPRAWKLLTTLVPPYGLIRQPHKIFCLLPAYVAVACALLFPALLRGIALRWRMGAGLLLLLPLLLDYGCRIRPTLCLLDREQGAFKAIAVDAAASGNLRPHLLSLPIWPGDSHYDSLNEYYVSLYGLRMVNGYGGSVRSAYLEEVFQPLESLNAGAVTEGQLDFLQSRGVGYLVLHEDCYPEKVSPFPVGWLLQSLVTHPRLHMLAQDGAIWSFKILPARPAASVRSEPRFMPVLFPTRHFSMSDLLPPSGSGVRPQACQVCLTPSLVPDEVPLEWMVRGRGTGTFRLAPIINGVTNSAVTLSLPSAEWVWGRIAVTSATPVKTCGAWLIWEGDKVEIDRAVLAARDWHGLASGASVELPAISFFHAGHSDPSWGGVTLRAAYEPDSIVFYGPKLPLEKGRYSAQIQFSSPAAKGTPLGRFNSRWTGQEETGWGVVRQGEPARLEFEQKENVPFFLAFEFFREADITIQRVVLKRLE